jgi:hypothetical protein
MAVVNLEDVYIPNELQIWLHNNPKTYVCLWGGADSGKSWGCRVEGLLLSYHFPGNEGIVLRATYRELRDETLPKFREWAEKLGLLVDEQKADMNLIIRSINPDIPSVVRFRSVDKATGDMNQGGQQPTGKFGSTEIGWFWIEEAQDPRIKEFVWLQLVKRMRLRRDWWPTIFRRGMVSCNPSTPDHWVYRYFYHLKDTAEEDNQTDYAIKVTTTYDNVNPDTGEVYYDEKNLKAMIDTFTPAMRDIFIQGKPAFIPIGQPVWSSFSWEDNGGSFEPFPNRRVIRIWDFGRRRSCVLFAQIVRVRNEHIYGLSLQRPALDRVVFLRELIFEGYTTYRMADEVVPFTESEFPELLVEDVGDIAGEQKKSDNELSSFDILKKEYGIRIRGKSILGMREKYIEIIEEKLSQKVDGIPLIQVDNERCPTLANAFAGNWTRDDRGQPREDNFYEHPADCAIYLFANYMASGQKPRTPIKVQVPAYGSVRVAQNPYQRGAR